MSDDDFDDFSDSVGQTTVTPDELYLIRQSIGSVTQNIPWAALIRMTYLRICKEELRKIKEQDPSFTAAHVAIDLKTKKVTIT